MLTEDIGKCYAVQISRAVQSNTDLPGIEHGLFMVLNASPMRSYVHFCAPRSWCANGGDQDISEVLSDVFRACLVSDFAPNEHPIYDTLAAFGAGFMRRLTDDRLDDRRISDIILFAGHPEGFGVYASLRPRDWVVRQLAKSFNIDLTKEFAA